MVGFLKKEGGEFIEQWTGCVVRQKDDNGECRSVLDSHTHLLPLLDCIILSCRPDSVHV